MNRLFYRVYLTIHFYRFKILIFLLVLLGLVNELGEQIHHYYRTQQVDYISLILTVLVVYFTLDYLLKRYRGRYLAVGFCIIVLELPAIEGLGLDLIFKGLNLILSNPYFYTLDAVYIFNIFISTICWFLIIYLKEQRWF